jgi:hypothetical protein
MRWFFVIATLLIVLAQARGQATGESTAARMSICHRANIPQIP